MNVGAALNVRSKLEIVGNTIGKHLPGSSYSYCIPIVIFCKLPLFQGSGNP